MPMFRKKPAVIEAHRWWKNGDHPRDDVSQDSTGGVGEGKIVRYFRHPDVPGDKLCEKCGERKLSVPMHDHGWIDTLEGGHIVCPGDWIITGVAGENYPCKDSIFRATYDPTDEESRLAFAESSLERRMDKLNIARLGLAEGEKMLHVDDFIDTHFGKHEYARWFFMLARLSAALRHDFRVQIACYKLFCTFGEGSEAKRYRVTGASRLGDVWLTSNFSQDQGYEHRVAVQKCRDWSPTP